MAVGELTQADKTRINQAVAAGEQTTGLEFCVIVGSQSQADARRDAERAFHKLGMIEKPAVMIMVVPHARTLEVVTAPELSKRVTNAACDSAVEIMTSRFAANDIVGGLEQGIFALAEYAGIRTDGKTAHQGEDLPNVVDLDDPDVQ